MCEKEEKLNQYWRESLREESEQLVKRGFNGCRLICFQSYSQGKGRRRKYPEHVEMLTCGDGSFYIIRDGEIQPRKNGGLQPDVMAKEAFSRMSGMPEEDKTPERLVEILRRGW